MSISVIRPQKQEYSKTRVKYPRITLIIPARNEEKNLPFVLSKIPPLVDEVILVDGFSTDRTSELAKALRPDIKVISQDKRGKGNAIKCGIKSATGDIVVMLDADGSMNPEEIPSFVEPLLNGYDFVKGSRFLPGGGTKDMEEYRKLANKTFVLLINTFFKSKSTDLCYGYMAFKTESINRFDIESNGFEVETELVIKALKTGLRVTEVPSFEEKRINGKSNLKPFQDGKRIIMTIFKLKFGNTLVQKSASPEAGHVKVKADIEY